MRVAAYLGVRNQRHRRAVQPQSGQARHCSHIRILRKQASRLTGAALEKGRGRVQPLQVYPAFRRGSKPALRGLAAHIAHRLQACLTRRRQRIDARQRARNRNELGAAPQRRLLQPLRQARRGQ